MSNNNQLKLLLFDAKLHCNSRINGIKTHVPQGEASTFEGLTNKIHILFQFFEKPTTWAQPIQFNLLLVTDNVNSLVTANSSDWVEFQKDMNTFLTFIEKHFSINEVVVETETDTDLSGSSIDTPTEDTNANEDTTARTTEMNIKTVRELNRTTKKITNRKATLIRNGVDLNGDSNFKVSETNRRNATRRYQKALRTNQIQSTEAHLGVVVRFGNVVGKVKTAPQFTKFNKIMVKFMVKQLPPA